MIGHYNYSLTGRSNMPSRFGCASDPKSATAPKGRNCTSLPIQKVRGEQLMKKYTLQVVVTAAW
jgi:hypothetical protein